MSSPLDWLDDATATLDRDGRLRSLRHHRSATGTWLELDGPAPRRVLNLSSNNYLGLADDARVIAAAVEAAQRWGTGTGSARLVTGAQAAHRDLEDDLADFKGMAGSRLFSSGYLANLGVVTALVGRGDTVVSDALNHASIIDACRLSGAEVRVYDHADPDHAEALLADAPGRRLLVTDGVFSMDGDLAPLPHLCDAAGRHGAAVMVDDAHGTGTVGPGGRGTCAALGVTDRVDAIVGTLSKSLASQGGYVAGSTRLMHWLENQARSFIFDTALAPPSVAAAHAALGVLRGEPRLPEHLQGRARHLASGLAGAGIHVPEPATPIIPVHIGGNEQAMTAMEVLLAEDVLAVAIRPPTVPVGTARLRATVMATHTDTDLDLAIRAFRTAFESRDAA